jgi:hypothetical protein
MITCPPSESIKIGDVFKYYKHGKAKVVDIYEVKSTATGKTVGYMCMAQMLTLSTNLFEVPFNTVIRGKNELNN